MGKPRRKKGRSEKGLGALTKVGRYFHFRITIDGVMHRHPTKKDNLEDARTERDRFLRTLRAGAAAEPSAKPVHETVTVAELVDDYVDYKRDNCTDDNDRQNVDDDEQRLKKHIVTAFGPRLAASITTADLQNYRQQRKATPVQDSTINWELARMRAAFFHGKKHQTPRKVLEVPHFPMVAVDNVRHGFVEVAEYSTLLNAMCDTLKPFFVLAFHVGCRSGELTNLRWSQVNFKLGIIQLTKTKNDEDRNAPIYGDMRACLEKQLQLRNEQSPYCEYVLFWHRADTESSVRCQPGDQLNTFYKMWKRAVTQAGHPALLPHDLRRCASRNMNQECGIPEAQVMLITGHKTNSQFHRYNIVSLKGIQESGQKMDAWFNQAKAAVPEQQLAAAPSGSPQVLSMKQRVRALFVEGLSVAEIAGQLGIAPGTVQYHISDSVKAATLARNRERKREARSRPLNPAL
jgi:integrase/DNA-binding CsgD family transcriptional regulator